MALTITKLAVEAGIRVKVLKVLVYKQTSGIKMGETCIGQALEEIKKGTRISLRGGMHSTTIVDMKSTDDGRFIVSTQTSVYLIEKV